MMLCCSFTENFMHGAHVDHLGFSSLSYYSCAYSYKFIFLYNFLVFSIYSLCKLMIVHFFGFYYWYIMSGEFTYMFQDEESLTKEQIEAEIKKIKEAYADDQGIYLLSCLYFVWYDMCYKVNKLNIKIYLFCSQQNSDILW